VRRYFFAFEDGTVLEGRGEQHPVVFEVDHGGELIAIVERRLGGCAEAYVITQEIPEHFVNIAEVAESYDNTRANDLVLVREKFGSSPWASYFLEPRVKRLEVGE